jgi:hypothetical protein
VYVEGIECRGYVEGIEYQWVYQFKTHVYSLSFADDQVLLAQDHDDMEYMARKLKEEYKNGD